jgi:protein O-GlcNAc transferase
MPPSGNPFEPHPFEQRFDSAMQLAQTGRLEDASAAFSALTRSAPRHLKSRHMLAAVLHQLGRNAHALNELDAAIAINPATAAVSGLRCEILLALGRAAQAADAAVSALHIEPYSLPARMRLVRALLACARWNEAADILTDLLAEQPGQLNARSALIRALLHMGEAQRALAAAHHPRLLDARESLGIALADFSAAGAIPQLAALLEARLERWPDDYDAALALAATSHLLGRTGAALRWSESASALRPSERAPREIHATALIDRGDVEAGLDAYRDLLADGDAATAARHLILMHYDPAQDNVSLFAAHRDFVARHLKAHGLPRVAPVTDADAEKRLRVGWLSPRLGAGPVATFLDGLLAHFDRTRHHHMLIDLQPTHDATAHRLYALAEETVDASGLDDAQLLHRLRSLDLDVLIDLAGHSTANRIAVLAERVAPLQLCWLDYFDTTALPAMDAWITDPWLTPMASTQRYSERVVRLASGRFCYTPMDDSPAPCRVGESTIVFGSFSRLAKLNEQVLDVWAEILHRSPSAQLELRARLLGDADNRARLVARFDARGIDAERLRLGGALSYPELLAAYQRIDIALDPFPFSGCTTTCDALWMGCPTITLPGDTFVSRQSASLLWRLGRDEWVARDGADYIGRTLALAANIESLRANREALREMVALRLCNANAQAQEFATALRDLWRTRAC